MIHNTEFADSEPMLRVAGGTATRRQAPVEQGRAFNTEAFARHGVWTPPRPARVRAPRRRWPAFVLAGGGLAILAAFWMWRLFPGLGAGALPAIDSWMRMMGTR